MRGRTSRLVALARLLRGRQTPAETIFWEMVRDRRLLGFKFRRQHPIGPFIADFYCHQARLVVELDGLFHNETFERDARRDDYLRSCGCTVLRFRNEDLLASPRTVLNRIALHLAQFDQHQPPSPFGRGAGGEGASQKTKKIDGIRADE